MIQIITDRGSHKPCGDIGVTGGEEGVAGKGSGVQVGLVKAFMKDHYKRLGGGANAVAPGYSKPNALGAEIIGTFVLVYTVFSATEPKRKARDCHVPVSIWEWDSY